MDRLESAAIPQADDLDKVRGVIAALAEGAPTAQAVADRTGFSLRHVEYRVRAAKLLGLIDERGQLTADGRALLATHVGGEEERLCWRGALMRTMTFERLAPDLFARAAPSRDELAERIVAVTAMAPTTARRRASTLLAWRRRLASRQLDLFGGV